MRQFLLLIAFAMGAVLLAPAPLHARNDDKPMPTAQLDKAFTAEIKALTEAETLLRTISDEKSAKAVKRKLMRQFSYLRPLLGGTEAQLVELSRAQNRVSAIMWEMKKQPYFESENMQELWTVMTHQFARRANGRY